MCTYENWPKTVRCAMCGTPTNQRSQASSLIISSPDRNNSEPESNQDGRFKEYILGKLFEF